MVRFLCDFAMPVLGGLPRKKRKTSLRTWSAPILLGILISSSCKPLTLLRNLVKSDVWTRVSFSKMLCSDLSDVWTETGFWVKLHVGAALDFFEHRMNSEWRENIVPAWLFYTVFVWNVLVVIVLSKWRCLQVQFDPGLTGARRFPTVLDYRDLCLYNEPRMCCDELLFFSFFFFFFFFFYLFVLVVRHPSGGSETWSFWVSSILFQSK